MIYDALSSNAIEEVEFKDGEVVDKRWILHHFDFSSFCIFGLLDDFAMPTARPGSSATRRHNYESDIQRTFYSGYLCRHGLKEQVVYLPIGIIGLVFITEIRQNNSGVLNMMACYQGILLVSYCLVFIAMAFLPTTQQYFEGQRIQPRRSGF